MKYEIFLGDCADFMKTIQDEAFDFCVTDPPYGINENSHRASSRSRLAKTKDYGEFSWDKERVSDFHISELLRVSADQVIFGGNYYTDLLPASSSWIVWDKVNGKNNFADCELAWTSHKKAVRKFSYMWNGMIKQRPEERFHPTQKPFSLMLWVIENYTTPGSTVFDPFMGSGTTGAACLRLGRNFVGCERDKRYFDISESRLKEESLMMKMELI